jgi:hypothetical protein
MSLLDTLRWECVRGFGNDDPGDHVGDGADTGEESEKRGEDSDESEVPAVVKGEAGADSADDAILAWAG